PEDDRDFGNHDDDDGTKYRPSYQEQGRWWLRFLKMLLCWLAISTFVVFMIRVLYTCIACVLDSQSESVVTECGRALFGGAATAGYGSAPTEDLDDNDPYFGPVENYEPLRDL
ncbi:hypothetical protein CYMTET_33388, partial [Cymbomonas tetramitiformis]